MSLTIELVNLEMMQCRGNVYRSVIVKKNIFIVCNNVMSDLYLFNDKTSRYILKNNFTEFHSIRVEWPPLSNTEYLIKVVTKHCRLALE